MMSIMQKFLNDDGYLVTLNQYGVYFKNYHRLLSLNHQNISFLCDKNKIMIKGEKLVLKKILEDEVFIQGNIYSIEVIHV